MLKANWAFRQTADTFLAASTFLELLSIWEPLSADVSAKIRYAKWNAVRIVKAIKEGRDPNESNPKPEPTPEEDLQPLDPNDPEVKRLGGGASLQPSVEEVPDEQDRVNSHVAAQSHHDQSIHPSAQPSPGPAKFEPFPRTGFQYTAATTDDEVSPIETTPHNRDGSIGGGYFPEVPSGTHSPTLPSAPTGDDLGSVSPPVELPSPSHIPPTHGSQDAFDNIPPQDYYRAAIPPPAPPATQPLPPPSAYQPAPPKPAAKPIPTGKPAYNTDDVAIAKAQKHARWAISALNFEDTDTAVKELRAALETLGA